MSGLALVLLISQDAAELLANYEAAWAGVQDYTCILTTSEKVGDKTETASYRMLYMKPGWINYTQIEGSRKGSKATYDPNTGKITASLGGVLGFIKITTDPTDSRVISARGERMDRSDFGWILKDWKAYLAEGKVSLGGEETKGDIKVYRLVAKGLDPQKENGSARIVLYLRADNWLPYQTAHYDSDGSLILKATFKDLKLNQGLKEKDFKI
jgi:outer membrane lipoprotein-sorting protein